MAYLGTTELSSVSNPPIKVWEGMGAAADVRIATGSTALYISNNYGAGLTTGSPTPGRGFGQQGWVYHTTDITSAIVADGYFTDAGDLGMRPGDICFFVAQAGTLGTSQMLRIGVCADISTSGGASFSTATSIISAS